MTKVTGVPPINPVRRIRRIDVLDSDDQKASYHRNQSSKSFKRLLAKQLNSQSSATNTTVNIKV